MGSKKRPPYDAEFREGAVRIVVETGRSAGEVAEELGINPGTLHSWVSRWRRNGTTSSDRPVQPTASSGGGGRVREAERAELERLRREVGEKNKRIRELEMERDVFKRCMALWVK
ncbi:transposase [Streptomyces sp. NY05-11A]|uniref:transposase n=1 Tax=Streptomyces soliscabiei TaxID=588897 RepID=UPI0029A59D28|nr:transposase [Streptomyces sp. NY05-11A]MDX2680412.1 transposase [Streptomyces sp. NY05-11A]